MVCGAVPGMVPAGVALRRRDGTLEAPRRATHRPGPSLPGSTFRPRDRHHHQPLGKGHRVAPLSSARSLPQGIWSHEPMNDDELTRLFRSLDEPAEPRAAFADGLLADLERLTSGATIRRRTSVRWLLVAATLLLVVSLGAALAVGSGLVKLPFVVVVESPTPMTPSSATASPSGTALP